MYGAKNEGPPNGKRIDHDTIAYRFGYSAALRGIICVRDLAAHEAQEKKEDDDVIGRFIAALAQAALDFDPRRACSDFLVERMSYEIGTGL